MPHNAAFAQFTCLLACAAGKKLARCFDNSSS
jgi:hypothetical protein